MQWTDDRKHDVPPFRFAAVKQAKICEQRADVPLPNNNISISYGLVKTVEHYLGSIGILDHLDRFKERGIPLGKLTVAVCTCILMGSNSMQRCADWLSDANVRKELGIRGNVSQKTINRAVEIIGGHADELIVRLWDGLSERYHFDDTDVNIDGSAVVFNGPMSEMGRVGYPRDFKDQSRPQVQFMTAQLQSSGIPFLIRPFNGNVSDARQYRSVLPMIFSMVRDGSWIIMDNGGASGDILDSIVENGKRYLTRVKMNSSDDRRIVDHNDDWEYADDGVCCLKHVFDSSGRTTYLFFSIDNRMRSYHAAVRSVDRMLDAVRTYENGKLRKSDFVTIKQNMAADVTVDVSVQSKFPYDDPIERDGLIEQAMGIRAGIFKLESSEQLTPSEALSMYRRRSTVEHLIHSLKRVTGLKPLRVWKRPSIYGSMMLALFSETAMAMARYELEPNIVNKMRSGKRIVDHVRPSTRSMVWSLGHLTVCRIADGKYRNTTIYSNWNPISTAVFDNIRSDIVKTGVKAGG